MFKLLETRFFIGRRLYLAGLGLLYLLIALILWRQGPGLIGPDGLTPVKEVSERIFAQQGSLIPIFKQYPSLLFWFYEDWQLFLMAGIIALLGGSLLLGWANWPILLVLWFFQLSLVNGAGRFWSFGWETMMLEMTWLALLFVHPWRLKSNWVPHYLAVLPLFWMLFRLMLGAGLIKIRGDACWLDLTCMDVHYETQPNPHFLSWYYHHLPNWFHRFEVLMTHFYELLVPFLVLLIRPLRHLGALLIILFQFTLITTGNLAFLNWQTAVLALICFDDQFWSRWFKLSPQKKVLKESLDRFQMGVNVFALVLIAVLSVKPISNMISPGQRMNESYDGLHLINSYGLFGSITKDRNEIIISGTTDSVITESSLWQEYEFICKPGLLTKTPCWITPYHLRLDWQMWFSAMRPQLQEEWLARLAKKLLLNEKKVTGLLERNPFMSEPPQFIKMDLYRYEYSDQPGVWWKRRFLDSYLRPVSLKNFK